MATQLLPPSPQLSEPKTENPSLGFTWEELLFPPTAAAAPAAALSSQGTRSLSKGHAHKGERCRCLMVL